MKDMDIVFPGVRLKFFVAAVIWSKDSFIYLDKDLFKTVKISG